MKVEKILHIGLCAGKNDGVKALSSVSEALKDHCTVSYAEMSTGHKNLNQVMVDQAKKMKPNIVFFQVQAPDILLHEALFEMRKHCDFMVNWTGDVRAPVPQWYIDLGHLFDITFFTNEVDVRTLRKKGLSSEYLEIGYDPDIYYPDNRERRIDVAFLANNYGGFPLSQYRLDAANKLQSVYGDRFKLCGSGWQNATGNYNHSQYDEAEFLRNVKIAINISHFDYDRYSSDRRLRILGCECLCLSHYHKGITKDFIPEEDITVFSDLDQMTNLVSHYLTNGKEGTRIAKNGHHLAKSQFTFHRMIDRLLEFHLKHKG